MKKILILHGYNTFNYGTFMMLINYVTYLKEVNQDKVEFVIDLDSEEDYDRLKRELIDIPFTKIKISRNSDSNLTSFYSRLKTKLFSTSDTIQRINPDEVIFLGGDDLGEYYTKYRIILSLWLLYRISKKRRIILLGQTIGPFTSIRKYLFKRWFNKENVSIVLRDPSSYEHLKNDLNLKNLSLSSDLAFLPLKMQNKREEILNDIGLKDERYVTIVPSGLVDQYTSNSKDYHNALVKVIESLLNNKLLENYKILVLPHVTRPKEVSDFNSLTKLREYFINSALQKNRILFFEKEVLASEARQILGKSKMVITGRMHAAISSFQMGVPAIALSYSIKYDGIIKRDMDCEELVIDSKGDQLWEGSESVIYSEIIKKVEYVLNNYELLTNKIKLNAHELANKTKSTLESL